MRIEELSKHDTPKGNPQLEEYLKTLTRPQMLQAARECCEKAKTHVPQERWAEGVLPVGIALAFYGDAKGGIADDDLNPLLDCIVSEKEEQLFRESLVRLLRQRYWRQLTTAQRRGSRDRFLAVVTDKKSPARMRVLVNHELELAVAEDYRRIIHADKNVRLLSGDNAKWRNLRNLIESGEVRLDPETRKSVKSFRDEIENITRHLAVLSKDANESLEVIDGIKGTLKTFVDLPAVAEQ